MIKKKKKETVHEHVRCWYLNYLNGPIKSFMLSLYIVKPSEGSQYCKPSRPYSIVANFNHKQAFFYLAVHGSIVILNYKRLFTLTVEIQRVVGVMLSLRTCTSCLYV